MNFVKQLILHIMWNFESKKQKNIYIIQGFLKKTTFRILNDTKYMALASQPTLHSV
jgi:hypothetical protein